MKLSQINEGLILQKMYEHLKSDGYFNRPVNNDAPTPSSGFDTGSRVAGSTSLPTGVPHKARHRKFLGLANRPNAIIL